MQHGVAVRLGGAWQALSEAETRHRALLLQADAALAHAEAHLACERQRTSELCIALHHADAAASGALESLLCVQKVEVQLSQAAEFAAVGCESLRAELEKMETFLSQQTEAVGQLSLLLEEEQHALERERAINYAKAKAISALEDELRASKETNADLRKELAEQSVRTRRMVQQRQDRERQFSVMLAEKHRLSTLLSKKDSQARQLEYVLKKRGQLITPSTASSGSPPPTPPATSATANAPKAQQSPVYASRTVGSASAPAAKAVAPSSSDTTAESGKTTQTSAQIHAPCAPEHGLKGCWPKQSEALVSPAIAGVQQRFEGWRGASPAQRGAALRSENAMLISLLAERDAALQASHKEKEQLVRKHAEMQVKWREARGALNAKTKQATGVQELNKEHSIPVKDVQYRSPCSPHMKESPN
ncbi:hypothetical protein AB1Y20_001230 [Prymnesium parvum]|uniref:Cilia- and flagella-associated protein 157 n=1 Tax=Prymnesium parvum TaxID=97485 RepID=A0AB34KBF9_PRYPA